MWDPKSYLRYRDERSRPFHDLLARVSVERPRTVVDLGCGPGNLTVGLVERWPDATIIGIDSSTEMIAEAVALDAGVRFEVADVRNWAPDERTDLVISNALLQWVPGHDDLLTRWAGQLPAGSVLAVQVPNNFDAPSHRELRAVAAEGPWRDRLATALRRPSVRDASGYAALLTGAGCAVDAWETTYVHLLPAGPDADHPVLSWLEGTGLRPVRAELGATSQQWRDFRAALAERLAEAYPVQDGQVYFPFRRVFFVAEVGGRS